MLPGVKDDDDDDDDDVFYLPDKVMGGGYNGWGVAREVVDGIDLSRGWLRTLVGWRRGVWSSWN